MRIMYLDNNVCFIYDETVIIGNNPNRITDDFLSCRAMNEGIIIFYLENIIINQLQILQSFH